jgi:1,4-alpha-glucan branching enzyme
VIKSRAAKGKADVTFTVDPQVGAQTAAVCGDWNDWSADADVMHRDAGGGFSVTVSLDAGRAYRFRYLLDGHRWDNDWSADAYQPNGFGGDDSVVDLTALAQAVPAATKKAAARKQATPKKVSAPKASSAKEAPKQASAAKDEKAAPDQAAPPAKRARKKAK